jgi:hypothetical protein
MASIPPQKMESVQQLALTFESCQRHAETILFWWTTPFKLKYAIELTLICGCSAFKATAHMAGLND